MKPTAKEYILALLFFIIATLSLGVFNLSIHSAENKSFLGTVFLLTSLITVFFTPNVSNLYLDNLFIKIISPKNIRFYGRFGNLYRIKIQIGEYLRATSLFTLTFGIPCLLIKNYPAGIFFLFIGSLFFLIAFLEAKKFKEYIKDHITITQNSP